MSTGAVASPELLPDKVIGDDQVSEQVCFTTAFWIEQSDTLPTACPSGTKAIMISWLCCF